VAFCRIFTGLLPRLLRFAQNPLHTFPRNFPIDGEIANLLRTC